MQPIDERPNVSRTASVIAVVCASAAALTACGNYVNVDVIGAAGFSHDEEGHIIAHVNTCGEEMSELEVASDRIGLAEDEENRVLAKFTAAEPQTGHVQVPLDGPSSGTWAAEAPLDASYPEDRTLLLNPAPDDRGGQGPFSKETSFTPASAAKQQILEQPAGTIVSVNPYDGSTDTWSPADFDAACGE